MLWILMLIILYRIIADTVYNWRAKVNYVTEEISEIQFPAGNEESCPN